MVRRPYFAHIKRPRPSHSRGGAFTIRERRATFTRWHPKDRPARRPLAPAAHLVKLLVDCVGFSRHGCTAVSILYFLLFMDSVLTLALDSGQVLNVTLSSHAEAQVLGLIAAERGALLAAAEIEARTYHLGKIPTPGRGYDDRLTIRLGPGLTMLRALLKQWQQFGGKRGGLAHTMCGRKYWISEQACREWMNDKPSRMTRYLKNKAG